MEIKKRPQKSQESLSQQRQALIHTQKRVEQEPSSKELDDMTEHMHDMVDALKSNTQRMQELLKKDAQVVQEGESLLEKNVLRTQKEQSLLKQLTSSTNGMCWLIVFVFLTLMVLFTMTLVTMRLFSK
jgi:membrane-associated HD superfamily phosphohydrolase